MLRRCLRRLASTNRYTDGSGRKLESDSGPTDLYVQAISNRAYPVRGEHWQPVVADSVSAHKGNIVISGGGVVGLTAAMQFARRGWHTTVVERATAARSTFASSGRQASSDMAIDSSRGTGEPARAGMAVHSSPRDGPLARPHYPSAPAEAAEVAASWVGSAFAELEYALVTRRAADALEAAGLRVLDYRACGVPVTGVLDHPGAYNSWLTHNLVEHHPFATKVLSIDMLELRKLLELFAEKHMPNGNLHVFYEHAVEAVYPLRQQLVARPWRGSTAEREYREDSPSASFTDDSGRHATGAPAEVRAAQARTDASVNEAKRRRTRRRETSLTLSSVKWSRQYAEGAIDYDLLIGAEGTNSRLRELIDVEGFAADIDMGVRWFLLRTDALSHSHIHRWLHRRHTRAVTTADSYHLRSPVQVPMSLAFPRIDGEDAFSVMVYAPVGELDGVADADVLRFYLPDVAANDASAQLRSFSPVAQPSPTIFCENLHNSVGLPSAVVVGDAAHRCHPFWMQGLAIALEDSVNLLNQVDAYSRHFYDAVKQYSDERGVNGDALRELTERCLYYERAKHTNPLLRARNAYQRWMNVAVPRGWNTYYAGSTNHLYAKSIEEMLNGRGYTSFEFAEKQQAKHRQFYNLGRLYT